LELQSALLEVPPPAPVSVAVITPYREQRRLLCRVLKDMSGDDKVLEKVAVETVDSFQGRQVDIVILSCVRAGSGGGGLGFVTDVRRMNVAITRARRALWVLGSATALRAGSKEWAALIEDAEARNVVIRADAQKLFPTLEFWTRRGLNEDEGAGPAAGAAAGATVVVEDQADFKEAVGEEEAIDFKEEEAIGEEEEQDGVIIDLVSSEEEEGAEANGEPAQLGGDSSGTHLAASEIAIMIPGGQSRTNGGKGNMI
jgi:hypothetical protein